MIPFPLAVFFSHNNRPRTAPTVLDEEYEWVFGQGPRASVRRGRELPTESRRATD